MAISVKYSLQKITAREVSEFNKKLAHDPNESIDLFAVMLSKSVVDAPDELKAKGALNNPDTYLELPFWPSDEGNAELAFMELVEGLNTAMEKVNKSTKKR